MPSSPADRCTRCAFALSATGSAKARDDPAVKCFVFKAHLGEFVTLYAGRRGRRPLQCIEITER